MARHTCVLQVFGSVTVQHFVRPGGANAEDRPDSIALDYHTDSGASVLHLGLSLSRGERRLRLRRIARTDGCCVFHIKWPLFCPFFTQNRCILGEFG